MKKRLWELAAEINGGFDSSLEPSAVSEMAAKRPRRKPVHWLDNLHQLIYSTYSMPLFL